MSPRSITWSFRMSEQNLNSPSNEELIQRLVRIRQTLPNLLEIHKMCNGKPGHTWIDRLLPEKTAKQAKIILQILQMRARQGFVTPQQMDQLYWDADFIPRNVLETIQEITKQPRYFLRNGEPMLCEDCQTQLQVHNRKDVLEILKDSTSIYLSPTMKKCEKCARLYWKKINEPRNKKSTTPSSSPKPQQATKKDVRPRALTELETDSVRWLLNSDPNEIGTFLASLRESAINWYRGKKAHYDAPLSSVQFSYLFEHYRTYLDSQEYSNQKQAALIEARRKILIPSEN